jgi:hypothetical protein
MVFWLNPSANIDSPKLVEFISLNPYTYVGDPFMIYIIYIDGLWWTLMTVNKLPHI